MIIRMRSYVYKRDSPCTRVDVELFRQVIVVSTMYDDVISHTENAS